ncbi:asparagine synthase (glutamine-hydrolyzing) [Pseudoalteromonas sp. DL2-H2.2]|uniref:asparagine synthase (glutamine-hydrolyzing) n=1 Tax=Pseudoalteromonas sp. DL2-H2.2 TaxID=2908889 RepID=UPI001F28F29B|nr:asparagine synthase (glutamine-hydrolyzing) [Pseudoalteromonas sp. DL2-H2.2]MCF2908829.1 asparagine synthase (glutamine-hydrolyzing) [Pseudoalteromonas sp. DL2-H2.2]
MCGIAGFLLNDPNAIDVAKGEEILDLMGMQMLSRGPDDSGVYFDENKGLGLSHRRLSIHDLSTHGAQPMQSPCKRYQIVFNGEIYNFLKIKAELESLGATFIGKSDTEVLLRALITFGVEQTLTKVEGMFAFALWDSTNSELYIARDRVGEKPLYFANFPEGLVFGSQLNTLKAVPFWQGEIDKLALSMLLRFKSIPAPYSIYQQVQKLEPGHYIRVSKKSGELQVEQNEYWSFSKVATDASKSSTLEGKSDAENIDRLDQLLTTSIKDQMLSDVPLGAFLSGGIDSSTVVSIMQAQSSRKVKTFSIGFDVKDYNEAEFAKSVAEHLGTDHTELYVSQQDTLNVVPQLKDIFDEPFADASQIPTYLVSKLAKSQVTVSLSGDAGDELFCGYSRYQLAESLWHKTRKIPKPIRTLGAGFAGFVPEKFIHKGLSSLPALQKKFDYFNLGLRYLEHDKFAHFYMELMSYWKTDVDPTSLPFGQLAQACERLDLRQSAMLLDSVTYLPSDILTKVDRAAMAVSLETRVPMLHSEIIKFAWELPLNMKVRDGQDKWILKQVLNRYVPQALFDRPKKGFGVPLGAWLKGPLKEWAEDLLDRKVLQRQGFLDADEVDEMWKEHISERYDHSSKLWTVLMFQDWYKNTHHGKISK